MDLNMNTKNSWLLIWLLVAFAGSILISVLVSLFFAVRGDAVLRTVLATAKTTTSTTIVPVEKSVLTVELPALLARRASPVVSLYRRAHAGENAIATDHRIGTATALTSDGWMITSASVFDGLHLSDVIVWNGSHAATATRGVIDRINRTVYFKVTGDSYPSVAFSRASDVSPGSLAWMEPAESAFLPASLVNIRIRSSKDQKIPEESLRRFEFAAPVDSSERGTPVWDSLGALVGIVEEAGNRPMVIPSTSIATSFASLLEAGAIHHASANTSVMDLDILNPDRLISKFPDHGTLVKSFGKLFPKNSLLAGDVIVRVDRDILDGTMDFGETLSEYRPGANVTLNVWRQGKFMDIPLTLGSVTTSELFR